MNVAWNTLTIRSGGRLHEFTRSQKFVLTRIADVTDGATGIGWIPLRLLAVNCRLTKTGASTVTQRLVELGALDVVDKATGTRARRYRVAVERLRDEEGRLLLSSAEAMAFPSVPATGTLAATRRVPVGGSRVPVAERRVPVPERRVPATGTDPRSQGSSKDPSRSARGGRQANGHHVQAPEHKRLQYDAATNRGEA